jgi:hypothetical protein
VLLEPLLGRVQALTPKIFWRAAKPARREALNVDGERIPPHDDGGRAADSGTRPAVRRCSEGGLPFAVQLAGNLSCARASFASSLLDSNVSNLTLAAARAKSSLQRHLRRKPRAEIADCLYLYALQILRGWRGDDTAYPECCGFFAMRAKVIKRMRSVFGTLGRRLRLI